MVGPHRLPCETPEAHGPSMHVVETSWILPATILGSSLSFIDGSVVNVALPAMQKSLGTDLAMMQWVANGYMLTLAGLILLGGAAGDRFGRRRMFVVGLIGFASASLGCGIAPSVGWLIAFRTVQGAAAALLVPASLALIGSAYSGKERGGAIGTWAASAALTTALGPVIGGWLVDAVGWRSIFFINLPLAAVAVALALKLPSDSDAETGGLLDLWGASLAVLALGLLSYGLIALGEGRAPLGIIAVVAAVPATWLFLRVEARADEPMMPLVLFRNVSFTGVNGMTVLLYAALSGALFLLPFVLIQVHGYSASAAGAAFLPFSILMGLGSRWSGGLVEQFGARLPLVLGPAVTGGGFVLLAVSGHMSNYWAGFLPGLIIVGIGMTLSVAPLTTTVFDSVPDANSGVASGINNAAARVGSLLAVASLGLSFGGSDAASSLQVSTLVDAYSLVMLAAAAFAALSALVAAVTVRSPE